MNAQRRAFTLVELLVVIASVAMLAVLLLTTLSRRQVRAEVTGCANNLRQLAIGTFLYANDHAGWLPPYRADEPNMNEVSLSGNEAALLFRDGMEQTKVERTFDQYGTFENAGYLFPLSYAGDGGIYFCPALRSGPHSAEVYQPLLTPSPSLEIRSSYLFNPHTKAENQATIRERRYLKLAEMKGHTLLGGDLLNVTEPSAWAHKSNRGWNVLFSDGAVNFRRNPKIEQLLASGRLDDSAVLVELFAELKRTEP